MNTAKRCFGYLVESHCADEKKKRGTTMKTIVGLYRQPDDATEAMNVLVEAGFSPSSVRILRSVEAVWHHLGCTPGKIIATDFAIGIILGIAVYSLFGVLVAVGEVTLGFERATALGALLIFVLAGVLVGGLLGVFFGVGHLEQESRLYIMGIRRGGVLVLVRTADEHAAHAMDMLRQTDAEGVKICWRTSDRAARHDLPQLSDRLSTWVRWTARGVGTALLALVLAFFIGESLAGESAPNPLTLSLTENFLLLAMLVTLVGIVVAWRWEIFGGVLIVGSALLFAAINAIVSGYWRFGVFEPLFIAVGLLFLWIGWRTARIEIDQSTVASA
jgi:hypothetical protein